MFVAEARQKNVVDISTVMLYTIIILIAMFWQIAEHDCSKFSSYSLAVEYNMRSIAFYFFPHESFSLFIFHLA